MIERNVGEKIYMQFEEKHEEEREKDYGGGKGCSNELIRNIEVH